MKEISLHIMDIVENSIIADATKIVITIVKQNSTLTLTVFDNGAGVEPQNLWRLTNPFYTAHPTKQTGLGIPLLKQNAEATGGSLQISSTLQHGTALCAVFHTTHSNCKPLGDLATTLALLFYLNPTIAFEILRKQDGKRYSAKSVDALALYPDYFGLLGFFTGQETVLMLE